jgi:hypothetical protein
MNPKEAAELAGFLRGEDVPEMGKDVAAALTSIDSYFIKALTEAVGTCKRQTSSHKWEFAHGVLFNIFASFTVVAQNRPKVIDREKETKREQIFAVLCVKFFSDGVFAATSFLSNNLSKLGLIQSDAEVEALEDIPFIFAKEFDLVNKIDAAKTAPNVKTMQENAMQAAQTGLVPMPFRSLKEIAESEDAKMEVDWSEAEPQERSAEFQAWKEAWMAEYRGDALEDLKFKLQSLCDQVKSVTREEGRTLSRLVPIVQSSGAGKSRLADEFPHFHPHRADS